MSLDIIRVQARLLEIAKQVTSILESNNIPYMICFGTLLGAVRHQGFIPWDDDFDIFIFDDSYEKARLVLKNNISEDLLLQDEETEEKYYHAWSKIRCKKTHAIPKFYPLEKIYSNQGLTIDLYQLKKIKCKNFNNYINKELMFYLDRVRSKNLISESEYTKKSIQQKVNFSINDQSPENDVYAALGMKSPYKINDIFPLKKYIFEDAYFYGPNIYQNILKISYGDYMSIPPEENRKTHNESVIFK